MAEAGDDSYAAAPVSFVVHEQPEAVDDTNGKYGQRRATCALRVVWDARPEHVDLVRAVRRIAKDSGNMVVHMPSGTTLLPTLLSPDQALSYNAVGRRFGPHMLIDGFWDAKYQQRA